MGLPNSWIRLNDLKKKKKHTDEVLMDAGTPCCIFTNSLNIRFQVTVPHHHYPSQPQEN